MFNLKFTSSGCALGKILLPLCPSLCMYKVRLMGNSSDSSQLRVDSFFHVFVVVSWFDTKGGKNCLENWACHQQNMYKMKH